MTRRTGAVLGRVSVYEPTAAKPYYRLGYTDLAGKRHQVSGSADPVLALAKADALNASLSTPAPAPGGPTLGQLVTEYTSTR